VILSFAGAAIMVGVALATLGHPSGTVRTGGPIVVPQRTFEPWVTASPSPSTAPLPPEVPTNGPGSLVTSTQSGPVLGAKGRVRHIRVAVESNIASKLEELGAAIDDALGDRRSWIGGSGVRFQRVAVGHAYDLTIILATRHTAYEMCRAGWVDIRAEGVPYTSCHTGHQVIINLDRWMLSVPEYASTGVPLRQYRQYVINHEVGHELGHGHELCRGSGQPAPVMQTQTLGLKGCLANPWPYLHGARYTGPPAP
jgi:Protein of unknown function (DUF3152)